MSGFGVIWRLTVYSGVSDSVQLFQAHSRAGLANPYLQSDVRITGPRIQVPECTASPGQATTRLLDKRNVAGDQSDRIFTAILGDSDGRVSVRHSRMELDCSDDDGATYQREFTGRVSRVRQVGKVEFEVTANDLQVDALNDIFDGTRPGVDWAAPPVLIPVGVSEDFPFGGHPTVSRPRGRIDYHAGIFGTTYSVALTASRAGVVVFTDALRDAGSYTQGLWAPFAPDYRVIFKPDGGSDLEFSGGFFSSDQAFSPIGNGVIVQNGETPPKAVRVGITSRDGDDEIPAEGTQGTFYIYRSAPPTENAPLHIGVGTMASGVHWAALVSGIAHGAFGGPGFGIDYPRFNTLIQDQTQPKLRFRVPEGPTSATTWLQDNVWPVVGYAPMVTASGTLFPVTYDPPDSLAGVLEFTRENTLQAAWEWTRSGQVNQVRIETYREQSIPEEDIHGEWVEDGGKKTWVVKKGAGVPVDALEEYPGERVIVARDAGKKRQQFKIDAVGLRPPDTSEAVTKLRQYAQARCERILDRFQDGPQPLRVTAKRTAGTRNAMVGDTAKVSIPWVVDPHTKLRGGTRVMLITEKDPLRDGTYSFLLLDNGPEQFSDTPTITGLDRNTTDGKHAYDVKITPPGGRERAVLEVATVDSGGAEPSASSDQWTYAASVSGGITQTVQVGRLASRRTHWFRARGEGPGKLPSAYCAALSGTTDSITAPSSLVVTVSGAAVVGTWTVGDSIYPVMPTLDGENFLSFALPAGSARFVWTELDPLTAYTVGVKHVDSFGGDSLTTSSGIITDAVGTLSAPRRPVILQGRGDTDPGAPRDVLYGVGYELGVRPTEPYANLVLHHDTSSSFTSPTAISGIKTSRVRVTDVPLDNTTRYFRFFHQRDGWNVSPPTVTVSAKPVILKRETTLDDGFPGGWANIYEDSEGDVQIIAGSTDPDADKAFYSAVLNPDPEEWPDADDFDTGYNSIDSASFPYSGPCLDDGQSPISVEADDVVLATIRFWNSTLGFGQTVYARVESKSYSPPALVIESEEEITVEGDTISDPSDILDGYVARWAPGCAGTWSAVRGHEGDQVDSDADDNVGLVQIAACTTTDYYNSIYRMIYIFHLDSIDENVEVESGCKVSVTFVSSNFDDFSQSLVMVSAAPASYDALAATDYGLVGTTKYADPVPLSGLSPNDRLDFTLNTVGLAALQAAIAAGTSFAVAFRLSSDWTGVAPTWSSGAKSECWLATADHATAGYRPALAVEGDIPKARVILRHTDPSELSTKIQRRTRTGSEAWPESWTDHISATPMPSGVLTAYPIDIPIVASPLSFVQARLVYEAGGETYYTGLCTSMGFDSGSRPDLVLTPNLNKDNQASCQIEGDADTKAVKLDFVCGMGVTTSDKSKADVRTRKAISGNSFSAADVMTLYSDLPALPEEGEKVVFFALGYNEYPVTGSALESTKLYTAEITRPGGPGAGSPSIDSLDLEVTDWGDGGALVYDVDWTVSDVVDGTHHMYVEVVAPEYPTESFGSGVEPSPDSNLDMQVTVSGAGGLDIDRGYRADAYLRLTATSGVLDYRSATYYFDQPAVPTFVTVSGRADTGSSTDDRYITVNTTPGIAKDAEYHEIYLALATMADDPVANGTKASEEPTSFPVDIDVYTLIGATGNDQVFAQTRGVNYAASGNFSEEASGYTLLTSPANFQATRDNDGCLEATPEDWFDLSWSNTNTGGDVRGSDTFDIDYYDDVSWTNIVTAHAAGSTSYSWTSTGVSAGTVTAFRIKYSSESVYSEDSSLGLPCPE